MPPLSMMPRPVLRERTVRVLKQLSHAARQPLVNIVIAWLGLIQCHATPRWTLARASGTIHSSSSLVAFLMRLSRSCMFVKSRLL